MFHIMSGKKKTSGYILRAVLGQHDPKMCRHAMSHAWPKKRFTVPNQHGPTCLSWLEGTTRSDTKHERARPCWPSPAQVSPLAPRRRASIRSSRKKMLRWKYVVSVCFKCFMYFIHMLQVFYMDVASVSYAYCKCFKCFICIMQVFYMDVVSVLFECCKSIYGILHVLQ
jgi:hypothetical protein